MCLLTNEESPSGKKLVITWLLLWWSCQCSYRSIFAMRDQSWLYFPWNVNLGIYSSWLVTWRFCMIHKEPEFWTDIRHFTTVFNVILQVLRMVMRMSQVCDLQSGTLTSPFTILLSSNTVSSMVFKKSILLAYFRDLWKWHFYIRHPWSSIFPLVNRARAPLYDPRTVPYFST